MTKRRDPSDYPWWWQIERYLPGVNEQLDRGGDPEALVMERMFA